MRALAIGYGERYKYNVVNVENTKKMGSVNLYYIAMDTCFSRWDIGGEALPIVKTG